MGIDTQLAMGLSEVLEVEEHITTGWKTPTEVMRLT